MAKKQTELSQELRDAIFEAARAGAAEAYTSNNGYVNYFKAMETYLTESGAVIRKVRRRSKKQHEEEIKEIR